MPTPSRHAPTQKPFDADERDLMDPETWDWEHAEELPPATDLLIEVLIAFTRDEYSAIGRAADAQDMATHAFITQVALSVAQTLGPRRQPAA